MYRHLLLLLVFLMAGRAQAQMPATLTADQKLYGLSLFWREATYNFAYFHQSPNLNWDSAYQAFIPRVLATDNDYTYYRELQRFCALLKDGHTNVYFPQAVDQQLMGNSFHPYRFLLKEFEGKAYVTNATAATVDQIPLGSEVVAVNDLPTELWLVREVLPFIASSTSYILHEQAIGTMLRGPVGGQIKITIRTPSGEERNLTLTRARSTNDWVKPMPDFKAVELHWPQPGIAQLVLNTFDDPAVDSLFKALLPDLRKSQAVIIDIRNNGGGSTSIGSGVLKYFIDRDTLLGSRWSTPEHRAAYKAWGNWVTAQDTLGDDWAKDAYEYARGLKWFVGDLHTVVNDVPPGERLTQPLAVLIDHPTASAAEDFLIFMDGLKRGLVFGRPTYGSTGQPLMLQMPGGGSARICTKRDTYPDGREFVGYGIQPDVLIEPTIHDYLTGHDPVLAQALAHLRRILGR